MYKSVLMIDGILIAGLWPLILIIFNKNIWLVDLFALPSIFINEIVLHWHGRLQSDDMNLKCNVVVGYVDEVIIY